MIYLKGRLYYSYVGCDGISMTLTKFLQMLMEETLILRPMLIGGQNGSQIRPPMIGGFVFVLTDLIGQQIANRFVEDIHC